MVRTQVVLVVYLPLVNPAYSLSLIR